MEGFRDASTDLLIDLARPSRHDAALDYACGVGLAAFALSALVARVDAVDELGDVLDEGRRLAAELELRNVTFLLADVLALPFDDGAFSLVVCRNALHRLPDPVAALREMGRVTSAGGRVVLLDGVVDELTDAAFNELARLREPAHRRYHRADELVALAAEAGLTVAERRDDRRTVDLDYWLQAASVPAEKAELLRRRFAGLPPEVQERLDMAVADDLVSFSHDVLALRLER